MEISEVKTHTETMHRHYIEMANDCLEQYKSEPTNNQVMKDFYLKKSTEYLHKAEALWEIIKYVKS